MYARATSAEATFYSTGSVRACRRHPDYRTCSVSAHNFSFFADLFANLTLLTWSLFSMYFGRICIRQIYLLVFARISSFRAAAHLMEEFFFHFFYCVWFHWQCYAHICYFYFTLSRSLVDLGIFFSFSFICIYSCTCYFTVYLLYLNVILLYWYSLLYVYYADAKWWQRALTRRQWNVVDLMQCC